MTQEFRQIVRIGGVDLDGHKPISHQLTRVPGVSVNFSNMVCGLVTVPKIKKAGDLSDEEVKRLDDALNQPAKFGAPSWMLNRRKDPETGNDIHLVSPDLKFVQGNDIKIMRKIKSYKGVRHSSNLPVRGQKTKSNFRRNKGKVAGVKRKK